MRLQDLFDDVPAAFADLDILGLAADSRAVQPGYLFAALQGTARHGGHYVAAAKAAGAAVVLSAGDLPVDPGLPHLVDPNPRRALALAAARFYPRQPGVIAAVTGTNGKSSTVDFLRQIWRAGGVSGASLGTLGAIWGDSTLDLGHTTADPVQIHAVLQRLADEGVSHVAMEASSHGLDQFRLDGVRLSAGAFTNLTQDHLDYHGTMDAYQAAKLRLFELMAPGAPAVINADAAAAPVFEAAAKARGLAVIPCGWRADAGGLKIAEISPRPNSQRLDLIWRGAPYRLDLPLIGEFQALNAVCAGALALGLGMPEDAVFAGLARLRPVKGRMDHVGATADGAHVFVDYAHTPAGLEVLLRAARPHAPGRIVLVFGCGGDRDAGKRPLMGAVAAKFADVAIVTDDNPRSEDPALIRAAVLAGCAGGAEIPGRAEAIAAAVAMLRPGDALLIAGKGHETGQIIGAETLPFSDHSQARRALGLLPEDGLDG